MELRPTYLTISRSMCLTIKPGLSLTLFLESPVARQAFDLEREAEAVQLETEQWRLETIERRRAETREKELLLNRS
nr:hypothetical protein CFP56_65809 [Quercus suber]